MPSFTSKAGFGMYFVAALENIMKPPATAMQKPVQFHAKSAVESSAAVRLFLPRPSSRKSSARFVPIHNDNPVKWVSCTNGYAQVEPLMSKAHHVPWSHLAIAIKKLSIRGNLQDFVERMRRHQAPIPRLKSRGLPRPQESRRSITRAKQTRQVWRLRVSMASRPTWGRSIER